MEKNLKKEQIIISARKLFYEYGYNDTSMDMIAKECSTQKQAISYYFNFKDNLALNVYYQIVDENQRAIADKVSKKLDIHDERIIYAVQFMHTPYYYKFDEKVLRFFNEIIFSELLNGTERHQGRNNNFNRMKTYLDHKNDDPMRLFMEYISMCYASNGALLHYCRDEFYVSNDEFAEFYFKLRFSPFIRDKKGLDDFYHTTKEVMEKLDIKVKPNFVLE